MSNGRISEFHERDEHETELCPHCSAEIETWDEWCESCGRPIEDDHEHKERAVGKPIWVIIGVVLALIPILYTSFVGVWTWMFGQ